jgi:hypothetical protein
VEVCHADNRQIPSDKYGQTGSQRSIAPDDFVAGDLVDQAAAGQYLPGGDAVQGLSCGTLYRAAVSVRPDGLWDKRNEVSGAVI